MLVNNHPNPRTSLQRFNTTEVPTIYRYFTNDLTSITMSEMGMLADYCTIVITTVQQLFNKLSSFTSACSKTWTPFRHGLVSDK